MVEPDEVIAIAGVAKARIKKKFNKHGANSPPVRGNFILRVTCGTHSSATIAKEISGKALAKAAH